jgi:hypothetical protein
MIKTLRMKNSPKSKAKVFAEIGLSINLYIYVNVK